MSIVINEKLAQEIKVGDLVRSSNQISFQKVAPKYGDSMEVMSISLMKMDPPHQSETEVGDRKVLLLVH